MAIRDFFGNFTLKNKQAAAFEPVGFLLNDNILTEASDGSLKSVDVQKPVKFPKALGEEHPFNLEMAEGIYKTFGKATSTVDKLVDFIVGPGWFLVSDNENALKICEDFLQETDFDLLLRAWVKEALVKGTGFMELGGDKKNGPIEGMKVLDSKFMYIERSVSKDGSKKIKYNQWVGAFNKFDKTKIVDWEEFQMAVLPINQFGSCPYGLGIISPVMDRINKYLEADKSMHTLLRRKANSPMWARLGDIPSKNIPTSGQIAAFGSKMENMHDRQEWATGPNVELKVVDFGNIGEKFSFVMEHDDQFLTESWQVPEVLSGKGNIAEGLAKVQFEAFMRRVQSIQAQIEKVIETDIFFRVLAANGLGKVHVEFEWGVPSEAERNESIDRLGRLLSLPLLDPDLRVAIEKQLAEKLEIDKEELEDAQKQRDREEKRPQPIAPGSNEGITDAPLKEYLGFQYDEYLDFVLAFVEKDDFVSLLAANRTEELAGKLSRQQIGALKSSLISGFQNGESVRQISNRVATDVKPGDLFAMDERGEILVGSGGRPILRISAAMRSLIIARSEVTRTAANGALDSYKANDIKKIQWVSAVGVRTCPICEGLNGRVFNADRPDFMPPIHPYCRCTIIAVTE